MRIGITGASGFVASLLAEEAARRGWSCVGFSRQADRELPGFEEVRRRHELHPTDWTGLDAVVNLAGESVSKLWTKRRKAAIRSSRVDLTQQLVKELAALPAEERPRTLISASGISYYGSNADCLLDEESDAGFGFLADICRDWEEAAFAAKRAGIRVVVGRVSLVFGQRGFLRSLRPLFRSNLAGKLASGSQWMSWIHEQDIARAIAHCLATEEIQGPVNLASPHPVRNRDFTREYARVLHRTAILPVPAWALRQLPGGMGSLALESLRCDPVVLRAFGFEWDYPDLSLALEDLENRYHSSGGQSDADDRVRPSHD